MNNHTINSTCFIGLDSGTTNSRAWLVCGAQVLARAQAAAGVRDTARDGSPQRLHAALRELIAEVQAAQTDVTPVCIVAAGMITSPLGLTEVKHVAAPAGASELAAAAEKHFFPHITELPFLLVPGVRTGPQHCALAEVGANDVMRGEETLCVGLVELGLLKPPAVVLNLGSHWKLISIDAAGRIAASVTTLSGELIHTTQTNTILASSVPQTRPAEIDRDWLAAGMAEQRRSGLARALFCVRLAEQSCVGTAEQRLAFLLGVFLAADLDALLARGLLRADLTVTLTGGGVLAAAWRDCLLQAGLAASVLAETEVEQALLAGCRVIASAAFSL